MKVWVVLKGPTFSGAGSLIGVFDAREKAEQVLFDEIHRDCYENAKGEPVEFEPENDRERELIESLEAKDFERASDLWYDTIGEAITIWERILQ